MRPIRLCVLGAGSWGTALAALASPRADVCLWARNPAVAREINDQHQNTRYLAGVTLPAALRATADFRAAVDHAAAQAPANGERIIILGVPVSGLADVCRRLAGALGMRRSDTPLHLIWTCKGISADSGRWPHEIIQDSLSAAGLHLGALSGPSFAHEVARGLPVALCVASQRADTGSLTQALFHGEQARIYTSADIMGVEVGGALKNVIAIACGISDGLRLGTNARAALITRGLAEIRRLGVALGGQAETFMGLTGLGDLVLTATGDLSRNRQVGIAIGEGKRLADILASGMTAEGVRCARAALALGQAHRLDLPITETVCQVLGGDLAPDQAVAYLLAREARAE